MSKPLIEYVIPPESKAFCDSIRYAEGVKVGNMLYLAGQVGWFPESGKIADGLREQLRKAFANMKVVIEQAGGSIDHVVQLMSFFADKGDARPLMEDFGVLVEVQKEFFSTGRPCGTAVRVKELALPELLVELQAVVAL
jgi:2-iminobutanoate/2-iminopropanoate deaminase